VKYERLDILLKKLREGRCSDDEIKELNAFMEADNGKSFKKYLKDDMNLMSDHIAEKISNKLWDKISINLDQKKPINPLPKIKYLYKSIAAAAIFGFLVFVMYFVYNNDGESNDLLLTWNNNQDTISNIVLPDGSNVRLHPTSMISYTSNKTSRSITLEGKATFDIKKNTNKPLGVATKYSNTKVLGTVFTIDTQVDSLESVYLHEGQIAYIYRNQQDSLTQVLLQSGGQILYNKYQNNVVSNINKPNITYHKSSSIIELNMADVRDVAEIIKVWYGVEIQIDTNIKDKIVHRINTKEMNLDDVIKDINLIANYKIEKYGNIYEIKRK
jgi:transmembrane sensor